VDLVLFDIDGTLVDTGGAGRRSIEQAAHDLFHRADIFEDVVFDGATDKAICRAALHHLEHGWDESDIDRLLDAYVALLGPAVEQSHRYRVYPGVESLIQKMVEAGVLLGLGTGNIEAGARVKLERGNLNRYFAFGGFGDDSEDRTALLREGLRRGEHILGKKARDPYVIGDTPRDHSAGRGIGAKVVLVATGRYTLSELAACGPDLCVETLEDPRVHELVQRPN